MSLESKISQLSAAAVKTLYGIEADERMLQLQKTRAEFEGDITLVVFPFVKAARKAPQAVGEEIGNWLIANGEGLIAKFNAVQGFLNLSISSAYWLSELQAIYADEHFGDVRNEEQPLMMVEYSSPNTNKPLHLGHVRNNLLGSSIARIQEANGWKVIKTNIVNDRGIHICKSMLAWLKFGNGETPESSGKKGDHLIGDYYVRFDKEYRKQVAELVAGGMDEETAKREAPLMKEAQSMLLKWEQGDKEVRELWAMMNSWVYAGFDETYKMMGVSFDKIYYESNTYLEGKAEVEKGLAAGKFYRREDGSVWADLTADGLDEKLLLRSDGTSVYMTQDIGTAKLRYQDYPIDKMVYVVGNEQEYHFKVLSILLDRLGFPFGKELVHFSYGMVELPNGKMKSREGTVVDADDLMAQMIADAKTLYLEKSGTPTANGAPSKSGRGNGFCGESGGTGCFNFDGVESPCNPVAERDSGHSSDEIARIVGLGALKYFILKVDPRKNMLFNPEESIDFNGNTGPFIQYTYARIQSVLRKASPTANGAPSKSGLTAEVVLFPKETALIRRLAEFPSVVRQAGDEFSPAVIANYAYALACDFNSFYHDYSILNESDAAVRSMRLMLSASVAKVIERAMYLLGIEVPQRM
ncbi:MAG: arginine--tRNA ligase [Paludibacteraceae bacterium]|nr:arginine--tRNA ligase [Paludibacteraceae bacterium]